LSPGASPPPVLIAILRIGGALIRRTAGASTQ
jgi:hypothetical protein